MMSLSRLSGSIVGALLLALPALAQEPLHARIDAIVDAAAVGPLANPTSDVDFLRRISLDLTGVTPTAAEVRAFLTDLSPDKRAKLIDRLLESPQFARHMSLTLDVLLMERRPDKAVPTPQWHEYLRKSVAENKPLDQLIRELITTDGSDAANRSPAKFFLDRDAEPHTMTRDLGRIVFGMDLTCAQCHDHPIVDDYYQADYYGLFSFTMRTGVFNDAKNKLLLVSEKGEGDASFKSVFTNIAVDKLPPQLPKGAVLLSEPAFNKGEEYAVKPDKEVRGIPKYSRRAQLAAMLAENEPFRRNLANRIWAMLFGRGLVHAPEMHHLGNPPTHPELLTLLASELKQSGFQLKPLVRSIVLTRAYQRSCDVPSGAGFQPVGGTSNPEATAGGKPTPLPERISQLEAQRVSLAARVEELKLAMTGPADKLKATREQFTAQQAALAPLQVAAATTKAAADKAQADRLASETLLATKRDQAKAVTDAAVAAAAAVAKLPEDKVLAEASTKLAERKTALEAEVAATTTAVATAVAASDAAAAQAKTAADALAKAQTESLRVEQVQQVEQEHLVARASWRDTSFQLKRLDWQLTLARDLVRYQELSTSNSAEAQALWPSIVERWETSLQVGRLRPLTAEQFAFSLMQATGALEDQFNAAKAKVEKEPPEPLKSAADADKPRLLPLAIESQLFEQVRGNLAPFVAQYGSESGDFQATAAQALYFSNGGPVDAWLNVAVGRLTRLEDPAALADELYLMILGRVPTDVEKSAVASHLQAQPERAVGLREMVWGLLSSNEFRFNH